MNEEKGLSARDISVIIRACKDAGVKSLQFGALNISFEAQDTEISHGPIHYSLNDIPGHESTQTPKQEAFEPEEDNLDLLAVEDPVRWGKINTQGE